MTAERRASAGEQPGNIDVGSSTAPLAPMPVPAKRPALPGLGRRLAAFVYEGLLLFGVLMAAGYLFSTLTQQRHALHGKAGLQAFLFVVLAIYFTWFWSRGGQTVAMKAWHLRLLRVDGQPLRQWQALQRFLLAWLWFVPAWGAANLAGLQGGAALASVTLAGVLTYAGLAWLRPDRQFWHDAVCGTQVVDWRPALPPKKK